MVLNHTNNEMYWWRTCIFSLESKKSRISILVESPSFLPQAIGEGVYGHYHVFFRPFPTVGPIWPLPLWFSSPPKPRRFLCPTNLYTTGILRPCPALRFMFIFLVCFLICCSPIYILTFCIISRPKRTWQCARRSRSCDKTWGEYCCLISTIFLAKNAFS